MTLARNHATSLDPTWAWATFEPSKQQPWNRRLASHLYRRAGFAATTSTLDQAVKSSPNELVQQLLAANTTDQAVAAVDDSFTRAILAARDPQKLSAAWVYRLLSTDTQLLEKTTLFWHGHFATSAAKVQDAQMMWNQNQLLRRHALGEFAPMVQGISRDPAMLIYLDSTSNRKAHPNENYARELMELFCLGEGNYSERDVQELARCFTGWEIKRDKFRKNKYQQDSGVKEVLGQSGTFDGEDGVRIVLASPAMPCFIVRKLVRYFVCDEPQLTDEELEPLTLQFRENGLRLAPIVERILSSNLFFSETALARKIRSPIELAIGFLRSVEATTNTVKLADGLTNVGQGLFYPPNVKGWDGGRAWINSSTLLGRANLVQQLLTDETTKFGKATLEEYFKRLGLTKNADIIHWIESTTLAVPLAADVKERLTAELKQSGMSREKQLRNTLHTIATLPEFQLG